LSKFICPFILNIVSFFYWHLLDKKLSPICKFKI
jgi:hypothetical protein